MSRISRLVKLHGKNEPLPKRRTLKAGKLTMQYENGAVRNVTYGTTEILRMVYAAVRGEHWITVPAEITNEILVKNNDGFRLHLDVRYKNEEIDFQAGYSITGKSENSIIFEMEGTALNTFKRNRIGFCILHPIDLCAGKECRIIHPGGIPETLIFPMDISPHQPFRDISSMQWKINENNSALLSFHGDVFETEDQRNWTDSSYKTYSTPLSIPYPVEVRQGTRVYQKIELEITGTLPRLKVPGKVVVFQVNCLETKPMTDIGIGITSRPQPVSRGEAQLLKKICFAHLRAELHLFSNKLDFQYERILSESSLLKLPVELCLFFGKEVGADLKKFLSKHRQKPLSVKSLILLSELEKSTPNDLIDAVIKELRKELPGIPIGAGTNCNFAQLNRKKPDTGKLDFLSFAIHPQEHAGDNQTLFENAAAQKSAIETAMRYKGHLPVHVSPVTLQRRFNANAENYEENVASEFMPSKVDVRQMSLAGAAWTVASLKYNLESGAQSVSYYETTGERGLMMGDYASQWPKEFLAQRGTKFPVYHVFRNLLRLKNYRMVRSESNNPLAAEGFSVMAEDQGLIFLANTTPVNRQVMIKGIRVTGTILALNTGGSGPQKRKGNLIHLGPYETRILKFFM